MKRIPDILEPEHTDTHPNTALKSSTAEIPCASRELKWNFRAKDLNCVNVSGRGLLPFCYANVGAQDDTRALLSQPETIQMKTYYTNLTSLNQQYIRHWPHLWNFNFTLTDQRNTLALADWT